MRRSVAVALTIASTVALTWPMPIVRAEHGTHVVVAEVQLGGATTRDEFVELYNPSTTATPLEGWRLSKRTASGSESNLVTSFPAVSISAHGSLLIAHPEGAFAAGADVRYTTKESLAADGTIVLYGSPDADGKRPVIDLVGWGTASSREGTAAPNPPAGQSLERRPGGDAGNGQDTDENSADFIVSSSPTPQGTSAPARPTIAASAPTATTTDSTPVTPGASADASPGGSSATTTPMTDVATSSAAPASSPTPTTGATAPAPSSPTSSSGGAAASSPATRPPLPEVKINEFVADPADGDEWIEIVNLSPSPVNLAGWAIEDGAEARTTLDLAIGIGDARFTVVRKPKGQLNNSGDRIVLLAPDGRAVDAVTYGDWDDGKASDNAPAASDPASVARVVDGADTDVDRADFVRTETLTPGYSNIVSSVPVEEPAARSVAKASRPIVVLNELHPNPSGEDSRDEFIELANTGGEAIDVMGWRLRDELGAEYTIITTDGPTLIPSGGKLVLGRPRTSIALNNTGGETVRLLAPGAERATSVTSYTGQAPEGASWARDASGRWSWTTERTPGIANVIVTPNRPPDAVLEGPEHAAVGEVVALDASDSADPDREPLAYALDFGDPRTEADHAAVAYGRYVYDRPGTYVARLTVTDVRGGTATVARRIIVRDRASEVAVAAASERTSPPVPRGTVRFSEVLANPAGRDAGAEWVEVENTGAVPVSLEGWLLAVGDGASSRRVELRDLVVPAGGYAVIARPLLTATLRNDSGTLALRDPDGAIADRVTYERTTEGTSTARVDGRWIASAVPTPGALNVAPVIEVARRSPVPRRVAGWRGAVVPLARIADVREREVGERVAITGVVTAPPGTVGKQILYLADDSVGIQVFVGKREITPIALGDRLAVTGELREVGGELRIGIARAEDVRIVGRGDVPEPAAVRAGDIGPEDVGQLIVVEGEVVESRGRVLSIDDGSEEIRVALPAAAGDAADGVSAGDQVRAVGVLSRTRSGFRILARSASDVELSRRAAPPEPVRPVVPPVVPIWTEAALLALAAAVGIIAMRRPIFSAVRRVVGSGNE